MDPAQIRGYSQVEFTHAAVAAYIASGMADASFGVEAAARMFDLDFVRLVTEDYIFACQKRSLGSESVQRVLAVMRSPAFAAAIAELPGYSATEPGRVCSVAEVLSPT